MQPEEPGSSRQPEHRPPLSRRPIAPPVHRRPPLTRSGPQPPERESDSAPAANQPVSDSAEARQLTSLQSSDAPIESTAPPAEDESQIPSAPPPEQPSTTPVPAVTSPHEDRDFTPPPKKNRNKVVYIALAIIVGLSLVSGSVMIFKAQAARNKPERVFADALIKNLSLTSMQHETKSSTGSVIAKLDFSTQKNPLVSTKATLKSGSKSVGLEGYGSAKDSFISYTKLPKSLSAQLRQHTQQGWIQVRDDKVLPSNVPPLVFALSDPRYQAFGPLIAGNFDAQTRQQLEGFITAHKVYGFNPDNVKKQKLGDRTMVVFPVKLDVSYLKISQQSAAVTMGFDPTEVQAAMDSLEQLRGAKTTIYIDAKTRSFAMFKAVKDGKIRTVTYKNYNQTTLPDAPQTKLTWQSFIPLQTVIDTQLPLTKATY